MKIRFIKNWIVEQGDGKGPHYQAGEVYEFNDDAVGRSYADKYVRRGLAVVVTEVEPSGQPPRALPGASADGAIPDDWRELGWHDLRVLAANFTDEPIRSKDVAFTVIEAELAHRAEAAASPGEGSAGEAAASAAEAE